VSAECPICRSPDPEAFLERRGVPVHQNLVMADERAALDVPKGDLRMAACGGCGFVFNTAFDASLLAYGEDYDNTQACSPYFATYLDDLARYLVDEKGVKRSRIVEVGSGKGRFLRALVADPANGNVGLGFDPSHEGPLEELEGRLRFHRRYYGADCADIKADVVVSRHVIEHVPDPSSLLRAVRAALDASPDARVFFETPCVEWILRRRVIWDFFYEHCSLFSPASLRCAFETCGFRVDAVRHVFNGQYLWIEASVSSRPPAATCEAGEISRLAREFAQAQDRLEEQWRQKLAGAAAAGPVAIWGAGAKGATFLNLVDPGRRLATCVIDINPRKQGCFIGGTGHPIVDFREIPRRGIRTVLMMNPNYLDECRQLLGQARIDVNLLSAE
jgi:SAM-dependent methyltransferase